LDNVLNFLTFAAKNNLVTPNATVVWEQDPKSLTHWTPESIQPWEIILTRRWGKKAAAILELNEPAKLPLDSTIEPTTD
jgi:16S rRNA G966 N2-methylase RsmD